MGELQGPKNIESEIKFRANSDTIDVIKRIMAEEGLGKLGSFFFFRPHVYFDNDDYCLARNNWAFRQRRNKYSYCLKYPISESKGLLVRREMFSKDLPFPMSIQNVFHRRGPLLHRVLELLKANYEGNAYDRAVESFRPRILIECRRDYYFSVLDDSPDWSFGIALDDVSAFSVDSSELIKRWHEIEIETGATYADTTFRMIELARRLKDRGFEEVQDSKYTLAYLASCQEMR